MRLTKRPGSEMIARNDGVILLLMSWQLCNTNIYIYLQKLYMISRYEWPLKFKFVLYAVINNLQTSNALFI